MKALHPDTVAIFHRYLRSPSRPVVDCSTEPSMTKQSFRDDCDVNLIVSRFEKTGVIDFVNDGNPQFGEFTHVDFQEAMNIVASAESAFTLLPAQIRARFRNDPAEMLQFLENPKNDKESVELGLKVWNEAGLASLKTADASAAKTEASAAEAPKPTTT